MRVGLRTSHITSLSILLHASCKVPFVYLTFINFINISMRKCIRQSGPPYKGRFLKGVLNFK